MSERHGCYCGVVLRSIEEGLYFDLILQNLDQDKVYNISW
jgi:hypothetical protein